MSTERGTQAVQCMGSHPVRDELVGVRLMMLMRLLRESGTPHYDRAVGYKDIERQVILHVGLSGGLSSQAFGALAGYEKAQVSRAIKPLEQAGLVTRDSPRGKLRLSEPGREVFGRIRSIARERDGRLTQGIAAENLTRFAAITEELTQQAARIYAHERCLSARDDGADRVQPIGDVTPWARGHKGAVAPLPADLIGPKIFGLVAYLKRSAMLFYQRTQGLSNFQSQVVSLIGRNAPLPMANLIAMMGRDKSQIGRTVIALEQDGLIRRFRPTRRRDIALEPTAKGALVYNEMCGLAAMRDDALWAGHTQVDRQFYSKIVDHLLERARTMIEEESGVQTEPA